MLYEAMLLFGVVFIAGWLFSTLLQQRNALYLRHALQYWLFFVVGAYFVWFWTHGGQTLAMKTWRIRIVDRHGRPLGYGRAFLRYIMSWLWFLPGLVIAWATGARGWWLALIPASSVVLWALTSRLSSDRQFYHDKLSGTAIIPVPSVA